MKHLFTLLLLSTSLFALGQDQKPEISLTPDGEAIMKFDTTKHDFGIIQEGTMVTHVFKFVNTGSADLVISQVKTPCSCTSPSYSKEPIKPGEEGSITIQFNSTHKSGHFSKTVSVHYNSDKSPEFINIKGDVKQD